MKKLIKLFSVLAIISFLTIQCNKDDDNDSLPTTQIDASVDKVWKYFSFEKGDTVSISNPLNSLDWDIAFSRFRIKANGGKSGIGQAGAFKTNLVEETGFKALKIVPDTAVFVTDDTTIVESYNRMDPQNPIKTKEILNPSLYDWYTLQQGSTSGSRLAPKNNIYIVKTANGKYAKLWIKNYYNNEGTSGHYTIAYKFQKDGSKKLE